MIYDGIGAMERYHGLMRGLDVLIDWLGGRDLAALPLGRTEIDGARVYANVMDAQTKLPENARYEVHHRYLDVQVDVEGTEAFRTTCGAVEPLGPFDESTDKGYCRLVDTTGAAEVFDGVLGPGRFAVFMVDEPHMPNLAPAGVRPGPIRKICFKVLDDRFWDEA